jgi:hypothetical protein
VFAFVAHRYLATREDCEKVLQKLYEVGKISPHDIEVFEDENKLKWMARVHALERVADKVFCALWASCERIFVYCKLHTHECIL